MLKAGGWGVNVHMVTRQMGLDVLVSVGVQIHFVLFLEMSSRVMD